jgi:hypothetical protein
LEEEQMNQKQTAATVKESLTTGDRERFEHWASDDGEYPKAIERVGSGYKLGQTQAFWFAWHQCSTKSPAIAVIESQAAEVERLRKERDALRDAVLAIDILRGSFMSDDDIASVWKIVDTALSGEPT